jgi:hypothetical protein
MIARMPAERPKSLVAFLISALYQLGHRFQLAFAIAIHRLFD